MENQQIYHNVTANKAAKYVDGLIEATFIKESERSSKGHSFDSAGATDYIDATFSQSTEVAVPELLGITLDEYDKPGQVAICKALFDGVQRYEMQHGVKPPSDIVYQAIHSAYATSRTAVNKYRHVSLDATSDTLHSQGQGLQPNRAVIAIISVLNEAIPFAHYVPADIGSNEARQVILSHVANKTYGSYTSGGSMDGILAGKPYITSKRVHTLTQATVNLTGILTQEQTTPDTCNQAATPCKLIRGRGMLYINGIPAAQEVSGTGTGTSAVSGSVTIAATTYNITGTVNVTTGAIALTTDVALPGGTKAVFESCVDYEVDSSMTPDILLNSDVYKYYAAPWRVTAQQSIDSRTQMINELGIDPYSQAIVAIQSQYANERFKEAGYKIKRIADNYTSTFDFQWATQGAQKTRAQIFQDFWAVLSQESQKMAERTLGFGATHGLVSKAVKAQIESLDRGLFQPSGITDKAGYYRIGSAFGIEWYYDPDIAETGGGAGSTVYLVGRSPDVARNISVVGDAVPPTVIPLAINSDMKSGVGFYARGFNDVNKHAPSAGACCKIDVTNLK